ncbi:MAG: molecular chaperone, partial [Clostridium sp.]|nr:molecular chaperone [Clostridium sp.]
ASITELKLSCVKGAIQYINARKIGYTNVSLEYCMPMIPYSVTGFTHENKEVQLIYSLDQEQRYGYLSRNRGIRQLELLLKDGSGKLKFRYTYNNYERDYVPVTYEEIQDKYIDYAEYIIQDDTDNISDTEVKFFVFAAKDQWGFFIVPITRQGTQLYLGREEFYGFENDIWEVDFFDGTK